MSPAKRLLQSRSNLRSAFARSWEGPFDIDIREEGITHRYERSMDTQALEEFNSKIKSWGSRVKAALPPSISSQGIEGIQLSRSIKNRYKFDYGEISRIGYAFARHGVFVHKGVGRGYRAQGDTVVKTAKTQGFNRKPKPWFNPVIESFIPELEQIIKEYADSAVLNTVRIFIR
ncbi:hypothetical protein D4S03_05830 [bacterium]|nr:MAG: hypothetical protein D4S03_05830 [bacterium]